MILSSFAKRCTVVLALVILHTPDATADEAWMCTLTELRSQVKGREDVISGGAPFFLHVKPAAFDVVVLNQVRISFSISENTQARLFGTTHHDLENGATSDAEMELNKRNGWFRQDIRIGSIRHLINGTCSKSASGDWPPRAQDFGLPKYGTDRSN